MTVPAPPVCRPPLLCGGLGGPRVPAVTALASSDNRQLGRSTGTLNVQTIPVIRCPAGYQRRSNWGTVDQEDTMARSLIDDYFLKACLLCIMPCAHCMSMSARASRGACRLAARAASVPAGQRPNCGATRPPTACPARRSRCPCCAARATRTAAPTAPSTATSPPSLARPARQTPTASTRAPPPATRSALLAGWVGGCLRKRLRRPKCACDATLLLLA